MDYFVDDIILNQQILLKSNILSSMCCALCYILLYLYMLQLHLQDKVEKERDELKVKQFSLCNMFLHNLLQL